MEAPGNGLLVIICARGTDQQKRDGYVIQPKCVSRKQKIVQGLVCSFEVFPGFLTSSL